MTSNTQYRISTDNSRNPRRQFVLVTGVAFLLISSMFGYLDLLPESPKVAAEESRSMPIALDPHIPVDGSYARSRIETTQEKESEDTTMRRIVIHSIGLDAPIGLPSSTDVTVLDQALLEGAVHYPTSAGLEDVGNILLFGHSSSLPVIHNKNYKLFNGLSKLTQGDVVRVQSNTHEYVYRVESVRMAKAEDAMVRFDTRDKRLTLVTCNNSFGDTSDRYVVEASFVGRYAL